MQRRLSIVPFAAPSSKSFFYAFLSMKCSTLKRNVEKDWLAIAGSTRQQFGIGT